MQAAKNVQQSISLSKSHGQNGNGAGEVPLPNPIPEVIDFKVQNHGSIFLLRPRTPAANVWVSEHLPEDAQSFGDAIAIEHRFISDIVRGIQGDGLVVV